MTELVAITKQFDGTMYAEIVPQGRIESLAHRGWTHRWNNTAMDSDSDDVEAAPARAHPTAHRLERPGRGQRHRHGI